MITMVFKPLGIDAYTEAIIYMRDDCHVCKSEGFETQTRVKVSVNGFDLIAVLNTVSSGLLAPGEIGLSRFAEEKLLLQSGDAVNLSHPEPMESLSFVRSKVYGNALSGVEMSAIVDDIAKGRYSNIHTTTFLTACAAGRLSEAEVTFLTQAMCESGQSLHWHSESVVDKHCVGGLPGNRTTLIIVPIVAAFGLTIPKTSSRAITSPSGSADTMEVFTSIDLTLDEMKKVVRLENGCIVCGAAAALSPADEVLIRVERALNFDSEGQLIASVLSKKVAVGSNYVVIDIPVGATAKIRTQESASHVGRLFECVGKAVGLDLHVMYSDGSQPVGRGLGPMLEARDVLSVLKCEKEAPEDLKNRSLEMAGRVLEFSPKVANGEGLAIAKAILSSGRALEKFKAICVAQGGFKEPVVSRHTDCIKAQHAGVVTSINNRVLASLAKLCGAPRDKTAGVDMHVRLGDTVDINQALFTLHADSKGALNYAKSSIQDLMNIISVERSI